jgi:hypothetical protein
MFFRCPYCHGPNNPLRVVWKSLGHDYECAHCKKPSRVTVNLKKSVLLQGIGGSVSGTSFHFLIWRFHADVAFLIFSLVSFGISFVMACASAGLTPADKDDIPSI